jgi:hypothetical protein
VYNTTTTTTATRGDRGPPRERRSVRRKRHDIQF